jgi:hypothetical protein
MANEFIARNGMISKGNVVVTGSLTTSGSLTTTGTITATTLVVQTITSSISSITGSTNFGSLSSDTHKFTGSLNITGSIIQTDTNATASFSNNITMGGNTLTSTGVTGFTLKTTTPGAWSSLYGDTGGLYLGTNVGNWMFINNSGNVGIGASIPTSKLEIYDNTNSGILRLSRDAGSQRGAVQYGRNNSGTFQSIAQIVGDSDTTSTNNGILSFWSANGSGTMTERGRFSGTYLRLKSGGIQFNDDTSDANSLDDYEEGTWTPTLSGAGGDATYLSGYRNGWYTKVGRVVNIAWFISFSKNTLSGTLRLTGLPFALLNGPGVYYPQGTVLLDSLGTATNNITLQGANNTSGADFIGGNGSTTTHVGLPISVLGAGSMECRGTLTYFTA